MVLHDHHPSYVGGIGRKITDRTGPGQKCKILREIIKAKKG
jgi:hypothetical protein